MTPSELAREIRAAAMQVKIPGIIKVYSFSDYEIFQKLREKHGAKNGIVYKVAVSYKVGKRRKLKKVRVISESFCECCGPEVRMVYGSS